MDFSQPLVMGILNVTPDSFSDGGRFLSTQHAVAQALRMQEEGADLIDIGGESTRPGAEPVSVDVEAQRILPVLEQLARSLSIPISIDTQKPEIMRLAVQAGAAMINDVNALKAPGAVSLLAQLKVPVCLMHAQGKPKSMQISPDYDNVVAEVRTFLRQRVNECVAAGIDKHQLILDPGFGFGKSVAHNYSLMKNLSKLRIDGLPILIGVSRKSMIGQILHVSAHERVAGALALTALAFQQGARIFRTHDVLVTKECIRICQAVAQAE